MKQALEALEYIYTETTEEEDKLIHASIAALRLAIEQAERQEPVAWGYMHNGVVYDCICPAEHERVAGEYTVPLYTASPQRQPLTDAERNHLWETIYDHGHGKYMGEASRAQRQRAFAILKKIGGEA